MFEPLAWSIEFPFVFSTLDWFSALYEIRVLNEVWLNNWSSGNISAEDQHAVMIRRPSVLLTNDRFDFKSSPTLVPSSTNSFSSILPSSIGPAFDNGMIFTFFGISMAGLMGLIWSVADFNSLYLGANLPPNGDVDKAKRMEELANNMGSASRKDKRARLSLENRYDLPLPRLCWT